MSNPPSASPTPSGTSSAPGIRIQQGVAPERQAAALHAAAETASSTRQEETQQGDELFNRSGNAEEDRDALALQRELEGEGLSGWELKVTACFIESLMRKSLEKNREDARAESKRQLAQMEAMIRGDDPSAAGGPSKGSSPSLGLDMVAFSRWLLPTSTARSVASTPTTAPPVR